MFNKIVQDWTTIFGLEGRRLIYYAKKAFDEKKPSFM